MRIENSISAKETQLNSERKYWIDIAKGMLIILIVWGHCIPEYTSIHKWMYSFHVPAFFIVNGILLEYSHFTEKYTLFRVIKRGIHKLIIPYYTFSVILLLARWFEKDFALEVLRFQIQDMVLMCGIGAMWFLPCMFFAQILFYILYKALEKIRIPCSVKEGIVLCVGVCVILVPMNIESTNFMTLVVYRGLVALAFMLLGSRSVRILDRIICRSANVMWIAFISIIVHVGICKLSKFNEASLNVLNFGSPVYYFINGILGSAMIILLAIVFNNSKSNKIKKLLIFLGKNSLVIMGTHQFIMIIARIPIKENIIVNTILCLIVLSCEIPVIYSIKLIRDRRKNG